MTSRDDVVEVLKTILDPEILIDIWTLGLIYDIEVQDKVLNIKMTFTSMACPAGPMLVNEVKNRTEMGLDDIENTNVEVVFTPPWAPSDELKAMMGIL